jgi:hypothetical protein
MGFPDPSSISHETVTHEDSTTKYPVAPALAGRVIAELFTEELLMVPVTL